MKDGADGNAFEKVKTWMDWAIAQASLENRGSFNDYPLTGRWKSLH